MKMPIDTSFSLQAAVYFYGIAAATVAGAWWIPARWKCSTVLGLGISLLAGAVFLFLASIVIMEYTVSGSRGMGIIILFVFPLVDAVLAAMGIILLIVAGIRAARRKGKAGMAASPAKPERPDA